MGLLRRCAIVPLLLVMFSAPASADAPAGGPPPMDAKLALELAGTYRFAPGHEVTLAPFDEFGGHLALFDLRTRDERILQPREDGTFVVSPTTIPNDQVQATLAFVRDANGRPTALRWMPTDGSPTRVGERVYPTRHEPVEFRNGDVVLKGLLSIPEGPGPHPAVVMVHGSGAATRNIGFFTSVYERLGIATLSFDKRGAGESTGNWKSAPFTDLADDVLAAVALLKARKDIDGARIGLEGASQGGWIGAMAAAKSPDVAWMIIRVGSGVSVMENMLWEDVAAMRDLGLDAAQTAEVVAFDREIYALVAQGRPRADVEAAAAKWFDKPWFATLYPKGYKPSDDGYLWLRANANVESVDHLRQVKVPVNWYFGATDGNVPTARSAPRVVQALVDAGNPDFSVTVLPSDHSFFADVPANSSDKSKVSRYVPGFFEANAAWLAARGFTGE
jgi:pimeloyl-ACP methyl ester carboxylesterase